MHIHYNTNQTTLTLEISSLTLLPFLETYPHDLKTVVADAGYGSEENLLRLDEKEVNHLIKYAMFDKEQKRGYKQSDRNLANWYYNDKVDRFSLNARLMWNLSLGR